LGRPSFTLKTRSTMSPDFSSTLGRAFGGHDLEAQFDIAAGQVDGCGLVVIVDAEEDRAAGGQHLPGGELRLGECLAKGGGHAHDLAGGRISGPRTVSTPANLDQGKTGDLT
jgi:hypothetical protein